MRKQTLRSLSLSYPKKDAHPSLGMTPTFREYDLWSRKTQILKSQCHTRRRMGAATRARPSLGMTTTKTWRSVLLWHTSACLRQGWSIFCVRKFHKKSFLHSSQMYVFSSRVCANSDVVGWVSSKLHMVNWKIVQNNGPPLMYKAF